MSTRAGGRGLLADACAYSLVATIEADPRAAVLYQAEAAAEVDCREVRIRLYPWIRHFRRVAGNP